MFSAIGTYVGLRGGNNYPTLIRKVEPKPLRIFLQDGSADLNIYGGDWWMANQEMQRSLKFAGYEVNHVWGDGGHNGQHATAIFADAMRWLWKDWPTPIKTGGGSPTYQEIFLPGEDWKLIGEGYKFTEGPATNAAGEVFYNDVPNSKTYRVGLDGKVSVFLEDSKRGDGQRFGPDGRLYAVAGGTEQILAWDKAGVSTVIADGFRGNDLVVRHDGGVYVTNPGWDGKSPSQVWYIDPQGKKRVVDSGLKFSNGLTLSRSVAALRGRQPHALGLQLTDSGRWLVGSQAEVLSSARAHTADDSGADGLRCDRDGRLYVATRYGLQICDQAAAFIASFPRPTANARNLCFGGANHDTLYVTAGDRVYARKIKARGAMTFEAPFKPAAPRL